MLLKINTGVLNKLAVTLTELYDPLLPVDFWLFVFTKDEGQLVQKVFLEDLSEHVERYNLFHLTEGTDLTFENPGDHMYEVYQMPDQSDTDQTRGLLVETGKVKVIGPEEEIVSYTPDIEASVYKPD